MIISKISLYNFGSYEGLNTFETEPDGDKNIVIVGGKNGAGKTTLFTAIRLCLYGYMSMGYKNASTYYKRRIKKLINNTAKLNMPTESYVSLDINISRGTDQELYTLKRIWTLNDSIEESFEVEKNGRPLSENATADFEKFIVSIIPPELLNLYFFDGERIADFFLDEDGNARLKNAFLTISGYDTFEIMKKNFKRVSDESTDNATVIETYFKAKNSAQKNRTEWELISQEIEHCRHELDDCDAELLALDSEFQKSGGITQEEWTQKNLQIKEEERKRESWNASIKKWANEVVPFLMIKSEIEETLAQISAENSNIKIKNFVEVLQLDEMKDVTSNNKAFVQSLIKAANNLISGSSEELFGLSFEQSALLVGQINAVLSFDEKEISRCKQQIKRSLNKSAKLRTELDNSNVMLAQEYSENRAAIMERKSNLYEQLIDLEKQYAEKTVICDDTDTEYKRIKEKFEQELKQGSINNISTKAVVMLEKLQTALYTMQIAKIEQSFRDKIKILMRKDHFIDDISIDDDFNIHIYRNESINTSDLGRMLLSQSRKQIEALLGCKAVAELESLMGVALENYKESGTFDSEYVDLSVEIDKHTLSNGEKQIFIMTLYHSMVQLCNYDIPFIIDTPFARIDTEHRNNIAHHFFNTLNGQVFILSTNEEVKSEHMGMLKDKVRATYMLENNDNKRTIIHADSYF